MKSANKKLNDLEAKLLGPVTEESVSLSYYILSEPERKLFDAVHEIAQRDSETFTEYERKLLRTALDRQRERVYRLFMKYVKLAICEDDPLAFWMFLGWFGWFMSEAKQGVWQFLRENEIYDQQGKTWKQKKKEANEFYKEHWNHDLFSDESFKKTVEKWVKSTRMKGEKHG